MSKTVVAFGELLWDIFPTGAVLGGAPANFAYRINTLGHKGHLVTRLGRDDLGRRAAESLRANGLSPDHVQWDDTHPTGTVHITLAPDGSPNFVITPNVAFDHIESTPTLRALAAKADCICFGTLIQRSPKSRATLYELLAASKALKVLDLNLRKDCYSQETIAASLEHANILKLNESEAQLLSTLPPDRFAPDAVQRWNLEACVITLGERGAIAANRAGEHVQVSGQKIKVIDTCGSGDAFTGGFIHSHLNGRSLLESCQFGNTLGAAVAQTRGATAPVKV